MPELPDHYGVLGVVPTASRQEIFNRYIELAERYHARHGRGSRRDAMFRAVCDAWEVLKDPKTRRDYDAARRAGGASGGRKGGPERVPHPGRDLYFVLGVPMTATQKEIKDRFRQEVRKWHPDVNPDPDATARMKELNRAWETLGDEKKRELYDAARLGHAAHTPDRRAAEPARTSSPRSPDARTAARASKSDRASALSWAALGWRRWASGDCSTAQKHAIVALTLDPKCSDAVMLLVRTTGGGSWEQMMRRGLAQFGHIGAVALIIGKLLADHAAWGAEWTPRIEWVTVPAGDFLYGEHKERRTLPAFRIMKTPVTVAMYRAYCAVAGVQMPEAPKWG